MRITNSRVTAFRPLRPEALWGLKPHGAYVLGRKPSGRAPIRTQLLHLDPVELLGPCRRNGERRGGAVRDPRSSQVCRLQECAVGPIQGEAAVGELEAQSYRWDKRGIKQHLHLGRA